MSTDDHTEERTDDRTDDPSPPNKKQKVGNAKRDILKHVFNHPEAKSELHVAIGNRFLQELLSPPTTLQIESETNPTVGNGSGFLV